MALTLAQAAVLSTDDLQRGVIETFIMPAQSVVLDRIPFEEINGNAFAWNEELALPGVEFRAVNAAYTESTGTFQQQSVSLVILGGDADVDRFIAQTRGNLMDQRAAQTALKTKALTYKFQDTFINGDTAVDANSFNGLKKLIPAGQTLAAATNGLAVLGASESDQHAFLDKLDQLISMVPGAEVLYMNASIMARLKSSARRLTIYDQTRDTFGNLIATYNGIELRDIGNKADGTAIIPQTETQGTSSVASSIYAVRFGSSLEDGGVTGLTNGGVQVYDLGELDTKPVYRTRIEFYTGMALFSSLGAARLTGVLNS